MLKTMLFLSPHTDDIELGCGGTIAKFIEEGHAVYGTTFSDATANNDGVYDISEEHSNSVKCMGISSMAYLYLPLGGLKIRELEYRRQAILEFLFKQNSIVKPDLVFAPSLNDSHQDHETIANEAFRAFQGCTILNYEVPWNNISFRTQNFIILEKRHIEKKIEALSFYKSQQHRNYFDPDYIWSLSRMRGMQVGAEYAEAFEVSRWIIR